MTLFICLQVFRDGLKALFASWLPMSACPALVNHNVLPQLVDVGFSVNW